MNTNLSPLALILIGVFLIIISSGCSAPAPANPPRKHLICAVEGRVIFNEPVTKTIDYDSSFGAVTPDGEQHFIRAELCTLFNVKETSNVDNLGTRPEPR